MASASHRRPRPPRQRRTALVSAVVVAAVGLLLSLVFALRPGGAPDTVGTAAGPGEHGGPRATPTAGKATPAPKAKREPCGAYLRVRAANGASVTVRVTNECPLPCAPGQLDLGKGAFAKLAGLSAGRIPISWSLLSPATSDTISVRYKTGSSRHWCGIQALGHRNPLARLEVRAGGGWQRLTRTGYNYFLSPDGTGCGGPLRLTDIHGERLTVDGAPVRPDVVQPTRVQFTRVT